MAILAQAFLHRFEFVISALNTGSAGHVKSQWGGVLSSGLAGSIKICFARDRSKQTSGVSFCCALRKKRKQAEEHHTTEKRATFELNMSLLVLL